MPGKLILCATPIGNLGDISARVLEALRNADRIAAEDTRNSRKLLNHFDIHTPMISYHDNNRYDRGRELVERMRGGETIALITDAGTPAISDPGEELVAMAYEAGIEVTSLPGPAACITALTLSGLPAKRFVMEGFLPREKKERAEILEELEKETRTIILYEAPHRLAKTLAELQEKITAVKQWLFTEPDRYHELRDTYDTGTFRRAVIGNALDIEDQLNKIGVFTVSFSCLPFKYLDSGQTAVAISNGGGTVPIINPTVFTSKPLLRINGSGDGVVSVVNSAGIVRMQIEGINSFLYIDAEQMNCYKGAASMNDAVTADQYPVLTAGENRFIFSGGITSVAVTPRWVTL